MVGMHKTQLPYFTIKNKSSFGRVAKFLKRIFSSAIRKKFPHHYLVQQHPDKILKFIKLNSYKHSYFLRFDIKLYYPSINHKILLNKLPEIYQRITNKTPSRRFKNQLKKEIPEFLAESPYLKGLSLGSSLSYILAAIFLLDLDMEIKRPFLRYQDDYLIFCKTKKEPEHILHNIIKPKLQELDLEINEKKLKSGKFHKDSVCFTGFNYYAGYFLIDTVKKEEFKKRIISITRLSRQKSKEAVIKQLNNQILGFGHYYKFTSAKNIFEELDRFIRQRLRRYLARNKDSNNKSYNLILTKQTLKNLGLKSLSDIYAKYALKNKRNIKKSKQNINKNCVNNRSINLLKTRESIDSVLYFSVLKELRKITSLLGKMERRIANLEKKVVNENKPEKSEKQS